MNNVVASLYTALFFASVPALLFVRFLRPRFMPWWLLVCLAAIASWVTLNLQLRFSDAHLAELVEQAGGVGNAPRELVEDLMNDGGPRTFAFLFGWLGGLVLLVPGLAFYALAFQTRKRIAGTRPLPSNTALERVREK